MMVNNRWFQKSTNMPVSAGPNGRFAERLDMVWFKKASGGVIRLGLFLTKLAERVTALETDLKNYRPQTQPAPWLLRHKVSTDADTQTLLSNDESSILRAVRRFKENNAVASIIYYAGLKITIEREI